MILILVIMWNDNNIKYNEILMKIILIILIILMKVIIM